MPPMAAADRTAARTFVEFVEFVPLSRTGPTYLPTAAPSACRRTRLDDDS